MPSLQFLLEVRAVTFFLFVIVQTGQAAVKENGTIQRRLQDRLRKQEKKIEILRDKIVSLESKLKFQNKKYLDTVKNSQDLLLELKEMSRSLKGLEDKIEIEESKILTLLRHYMIQSFEMDPSDEDIYMDKMMVQGLLKKRDIYEKLKQDFFSLKSETNILTKRVNRSKENEKDLRDLIAVLENNKGRMTRDFVDHKSLLRSLKGQRAKRKALQLVKNDDKSHTPPLFKMEVPLRSFLAIKKDKKRKGLVYKFGGEHPVFSTYGGKIQYLGRLANYGNLVIINHGRHIRSVLLGDIDPQVKKGQKVKRGEILAKTKVIKGDYGQLYFEVRVKDSTHNTLSWIDRRSLKIALASPGEEVR
ncbi:MAG: peptidoglycan DD-metalloendopeptidase family protein [Bacteriovoracales bacterium]|nr:peptidoglycan DD-metalloendopeptidase family protein [Bacteriovoracales bacterium]